MTLPSPESFPAILAPAGNREAFLAALAAGADAVYCGLTRFSARMAADNFSIPELAALTDLAHAKKTRVFLAMNSLIKPGELDEAAMLLGAVQEKVRPDGLILQDLALLPLVRQSGFGGELHLSTLANVTFPAALAFIQRHLPVHSVVLPREISIDEIRALAEACPTGLNLEVFVHGALCFGVSGRCYWSSYLGGKSGLRGHCVQPCRRQYRQGKEKASFFSCVDLGLDVLVKVLTQIPQIRALKIEGRKKGPHYVYYTVAAYKLLRDMIRFPGEKTAMKKAALELLEQALGRPTTHYRFLSQRPQPAVNLDAPGGSGLFLGRLKGDAANPYLSPRQALLPGDRLRIGSEDQKGHAIVRIQRAIPAKGQFHVKGGGPARPRPDMPVFLIDRREKALADMLTGLKKELSAIAPDVDLNPVRHQGPLPLKKNPVPATDLYVRRDLLPPASGSGAASGFWLSMAPLPDLARKEAARTWLWLPPVIWPADEARWQSQVQAAAAQGFAHLVLNAPWQMALVPDPLRRKGAIWAGPFCNITNPLAAESLRLLGFSGVIVSPELDRQAFLDLARTCPLPLGVILSGYFPLCVARTLHPAVKTDQPLFSPRKETLHIRPVDHDFWLYPDWPIDLSKERQVLIDAGYRLFVQLTESVPPDVSPPDIIPKKRPGLWNYRLSLS